MCFSLTQLLQIYLYPACVFFLIISSTPQGGVILVSHDESLIRMVCKELWVCGSGTVKAMEGGIDAYKKMVEKEFAMQK